MLHTDADFQRATEQAVTEVEATTDAEIIVVAAPRSGSYRDVAFLVGGAVAWLSLLFLLFSPFSFAPAFIPVDLVLIGALAAWMANRSPALLRRLSSHVRKEQNVAHSASAAFHEEAVHGTRGRTGVLVYVSALEDKVLVIPDAGILAKVPQGELNTVRWGPKSDLTAPGDLAHFVEGLKALGKVLAARIPPLHDNPNEVSNAPRIRS